MMRCSVRIVCLGLKPQAEACPVGQDAKHAQVP